MTQFLDSLVEPLGWTLIHFLWQGLLIGLFHELALLATAHRSPQLRYGISLLALLLAVAVPIITFTVLAFDFTAQATTREVAELAPQLANHVVAATAETPRALTMALDYSLPYVVILWLLGVSALSIRFGVGLYSLRRLAANADYAAVSDWMIEELARLTQRMRIGRGVRIALSTHVNSPLVVGWLKPVIFLPLSAATGLDHQQIRMVIAHELAHLQRHDHFVNFLQVIVETVLFYHPAVHRISRSLRQEREQCCDDMAASISGNALAYARVLAQLEEMRQKERAHVLALGIAEQELYVRIQRLVGAPPRTGFDRRLPLMLIALAATFAIGTAPDPGAPLLPEFGQGVPKRQRIALELPQPAPARRFLPIADSTDEAVEVVAGPDPLPAGSSDRAPSAPGSDALPETSRVARKKAEPVVQRPVADATEIASTRNVVNDNAGETVLPPAASTNHDKVTEEPAMKSEPVLTGGELLHAEEPVYPRRALKYQEEGQVLLEFTITPQGTVTDASVVEATPRRIFDNAALQAIEQWRFQPFAENGVPIARRATQLISFRLAVEPSRRTVGVSDCKEQTGTRICRPIRTEDTQLVVGTN